MNDLLNEASLRELSVRPGDRILDLGSGLGQFSRAMARAAGPEGRVVGVERSPGQRAQARALARAAGEGALVEFRAGNAEDPPLAPEEWGSFDLAHARFLLEHLPEPLAAVRVMVRSVRPGGRVVLTDDDHDLLRFHPACPPLERVWTAYVASYARHGNDAFVGRRLVGLLREAGARPHRARWIFFGGCASEPHFSALVANLEGVLRSGREDALATGAIDRAAFDRGLAELRRWSRAPDATFWYGLPWAEGVAPFSPRRARRST
jgi:ubiquinone/menaquinone biosynthesis C-methylase UbiE